jgi:hypothetical protein
LKIENGFCTKDTFEITKNVFKGVVNPQKSWVESGVN